MVRITLTGDDLPGFVSAGFDDHVKVFFPPPGADRPVLPVNGPDGPVYPEGATPPVSRDFTPRRYDAVANTLDIDFALHEAGPAATWAAQARPGQMLGIGGPRGSFVIPDDFDWYLFVGDETALPAMGRRLEELRAGSRAIVLAEVVDAREEQALTSRASVETIWLHRHAQASGAAERFSAAIDALTLPPGDGYAWVACESETAKVLRRQLIDKPGIRKEWLKAAGYWRPGVVSTHERHDD
jgi:NADPH-dependent ferric siderophore reductase